MVVLEGLKIKHMTFLQRLAQVINANGYANQVVVMAATNPLYGTVSTLLPPSNDGFDRLYTTVQAAVNSGAIVPYRGDEILLAPGAYDEAVVIPHTNTLTGTVNGGFSIIGLGGRGDAAIAPTAAGAKAMINNANDVTFVNIDFAGDDTSTASFSSTGSRLRCVNCKFETQGTPAVGSASASVGPGSVAAVSAGTAGNCGDVLFKDCEFAWCYNGFELKASDYGQATEIEIANCWFHDTSNTSLIGTPGAFGIGSVGGLNCHDNVFSVAEDGTKPSDYVNVNTGFDTGIVTKNSFALATNAAADLKVGAKILWVVNQTEAGNSTARPA